MKKLNKVLMLIMSLALVAGISACGMSGSDNSNANSSLGINDSSSINESTNSDDSTDSEDSTNSEEHQHVLGEWETDGVNHWKECDGCEEELEKGACTPGSMYKADSENHWFECTTCGGAMQTEAHDYVTKYDEACSMCGEDRDMVTVTYKNGDEELDTITIGKGTTADDFFVDYSVVTWMNGEDVFDLTTPVMEDVVLTVGTKVEHAHAFTWEVGTEEDEGYDIGTCECGKVEKLATILEVENMQYIDITATSAEVELVLPEGFTAVSVAFGEKSFGEASDNKIAIDPSVMFDATEYGVCNLTVIAKGTDNAEHAFTMPIIAVTKFLTTVEDLALLKLTEADKKIEGYYVLAGDIDGKGATISSDKYAWNGNSGFCGTLDGNGYSISNITVTGCGIFSHIGAGAVVKDVNFNGISLGAGIWGSTGAPLFARVAANFSKFENITVNFASIKSDINTKEYGLLISRQMAVGAENPNDPTWKNVTLNAKGLTVPNVLGLQVADRIKFENVVVNAGKVTVLGAKDDKGEVVIETREGITLNIPKQITTFTAAEGDATTLTLKNEAFVVDAKVQVTANAIEKELTVATAGELTITLADFSITALGKLGVSVMIGTQEYVFTDVWYVTKVINEFADLSLLSNTKNARNTGYYILGGDIHGKWGTIQGGGTTAWNQNQGFGGVFDGRGYTIDRFSVSGYGIFGGLGKGVVRNVNFDMVTLNAGAALLGRTMYNSTIENVTLKLNDYKATSGECGIFVMRQTNTNAVYRNITVDANGKDIYNVLGREVNASTTVENFVINNAGTITLYGASDTADTPITKPDGMTINPAVTE